jgi:hypothetical protein
LSLALTAGSFRMPPTAVGAGGVVEQQITLGPLATPQPSRLDRPELKHDLSGQAGHESRVCPLQLQLEAWLAVGDVEPRPGAAWVGECGEVRSLLLEWSAIQEAIDEVHDDPVQPSQSNQLGRRDPRSAQCCRGTGGRGEWIGMHRGTATGLAGDREVGEPDQNLWTHVANDAW